MRAGRPGAMLAPKLEIGMTRYTADLSWKTALSGGQETHYDYRYRTAGGSWTQVDDQTGHSATQASLSLGVGYQFQVRAANTAGDGPWSAAEAWITLPSTVPSQPQNFYLNPMHQRMGISFTEGDYARHWEIELAEVGESWDSDPPDHEEVKSKHYMIHGLTNGTTYKARVRGHNAEGAGPWSATNQVTIVARAPHPVWVSAGYQALGGRLAPPGGHRCLHGSLSAKPGK